MRDIFYLQALAEAQAEEMAKDNEVIVLGLDVEKMGDAFGQCAGLYDKFGPERVMNMPIAESGYTNVGIGLAMTGKRPIVVIQFADFSSYSFDAIVNQAAKMRYMSGGAYNIPIVFRMPQGAGFEAAAQHSQSVESWYANVPGLKIVMPSNPYDAKGLLKAAIRDNDPVIFLEHKGLLGVKGHVPQDEYIIPLGEAKVVQEGTDVTIIALQAMVAPAMEAAAELAQEGIKAEIIDPRTIIPLDKKTIEKSLKKTNKVVIAHEAHKRAGFGAEISAVITEEYFDYLKAPIKRVGAYNIPFSYGPAEKYALPTTKDIIKAVKEIC